MFSIRRIYDDILPINQAAIREVKQIFAEQFPAASSEEIENLEAKLRNPLEHKFRTILFVAEKGGHVSGFAILFHEPKLKFSFLDWVAAGKQVIGRGVGAALYERLRGESRLFGDQGLFYECLPDDAERCKDPAILKQNAARLRFYEQYGARPIIETLYELPVPGGDSNCLPHLMYDDLDSGQPLKRKFAREVVRAVLERKYESICPPAYVEQVVQSFRDDPVKLRDFRYRKPAEVRHESKLSVPAPIGVTVNDKHEIHHVRERGYVESPVRIKAILTELTASNLIEKVPVKEHPMKWITAVHDPLLVNYLREACAHVPPGKSVYPYVFPIRNATRPPKELSVRAGYFCIDTFTPINQNAFPAAKRAVDCALTSAEEILHGRRLSYALVRPPGHHAEHKVFGGFCYFNNAAIAANYLSRYGKVAILDVDYHHGNGQQDIFYRRSDVLTVSIHGDPQFAYPYFTGFPDERGEGEGEGFNLNIALPEIQDGTQYRRALNRARQFVADFKPAFLVVALGLDPAKGDPTGTWSLGAKDFQANGEMLGEMALPTLVVQEGGYRTRTLGVNAAHFFRGLVSGSQRL